MAPELERTRELWVLGVKSGTDREQLLCSYLVSGGYNIRVEQFENLTTGKPLGIVLDISPYSDDGWGLLLKIKKNPATRNIPVLLVFLSEKGKVGGIFPVAGFFTQPVQQEYVLERLAVYGLTEEAETWDLQALVVTRAGDEKLTKVLETVGFEVVNAYNGNESLALTSIHPKYMAFVNLMLPDMSAFELMEKFKHYPYSSNMPVFVMLKEEMKEGEKVAMSREMAHLVSKRQLTCEEFLSHLRRRG